MRIALLLVLLLGCNQAAEDVSVDDTDEDPTTSVPDPTVDETTDADPWFCTDESPSVTADGIYQEVQTEHYQMRLAVTPERAVELGRFAEAAWDAMADYYGAEPTDLPLEVGLYPDRYAFDAAIIADGLTPPGGAGGYYHPDSKAAYALVPPTQYYEDSIVLHEMLHQFHFLARTGNQNVPSWFSEGTAEALSRHDWDLECLRLGRVPTLSQEDDYASAAAELSGGLDLTAVLTESSSPSRPVAMAIYQHLDRVHPDDFATFRDAMDGHTADPLGDFEAIFGDANAIGDDVVAWIDNNQEPMTPVYLEWIHRTPTTVESIFVNGASSFARVKVPPSVFEVDVHAGAGDWNGGVLLSWDDHSNYTAAFAASGGSVSIFEVIDGGVDWFDIGTAPALDGGKHTWTLSHSGGNAEFSIGEDSFEQPVQQAPSAGFAVYDSDLRFELR